MNYHLFYVVATCHVSLSLPFSLYLIVSSMIQVSSLRTNDQERERQTHILRVRVREMEN